ncbi:rRNA maturation RNase YbeY [Marinobacter sp. JSM 1782161]|uniref:rRNA maturation RNase YbeY n=1 Tax=Marinobacter sp. JSM 1782161 TaxID=2685906 RepID=UPI001402ECD0
MTDLAVDIQHASAAAGLPDDDNLATWAAKGWQGDEDSEVTLRIVDEDESAALNGQYRQKDRPTNVLSFPFEQPEGITLPLAGDLVICAPVVAREAHEQGKTLSAHWAHMVIHGMLHLQGYDHIDDRDAEIMETLEIRLLAELGFSNPYLAEDTDQDS